MKIGFLKHFQLNDVMERAAGLPHAHLLCMLCEEKYSPPRNAPDDWVPVPQPDGLDDWYNWEVEQDLLGVIKWAGNHMQKFHSEQIEVSKGGDRE